MNVGAKKLDQQIEDTVISSCKALVLLLMAFVHSIFQSVDFETIVGDAKRNTKSMNYSESSKLLEDFLTFDGLLQYRIFQILQLVIRY